MTDRDPQVRFPLTEGPTGRQALIPVLLARSHTIPSSSNLLAVAEHGRARAGTAGAGRAAARDVMRRLGELGVAIDDVTDALERQGLDAFVADCEALLATLDDRLASAEG